MNNFTSLPTSDFNNLIAMALKSVPEQEPSNSVLDYVKAFARNFRIENEMPEGLQEISLS